MKQVTINIASENLLNHHGIFGPFEHIENLRMASYIDGASKKYVIYETNNRTVAHAGSCMDPRCDAPTAIDSMEELLYFGDDEITRSIVGVVNETFEVKSHAKHKANSMIGHDRNEDTEEWHRANDYNGNPGYDMPEHSMLMESNDSD